MRVELLSRLHAISGRQYATTAVGSMGVIVTIFDRADDGAVRFFELLIPGTVEGRVVNSLDDLFTLEIELIEAGGPGIDLKPEWRVERPTRPRLQGLRDPKMRQ